eukprot:6184934-Ditylum_brightwellii.AAC.1
MKRNGNMMSTNKRDTALEHILMVLEYDEDERETVQKHIKLRRIGTMTREVLKYTKGFNTGMIAEILALKE